MQLENDQASADQQTLRRDTRDGIPIEEPDADAGGRPARDGVNEAAGAAAAAGEESEAARRRRELAAVRRANSDLLARRLELQGRIAAFEREMPLPPGWVSQSIRPVAMMMSLLLFVISNCHRFL